MESQRAMLIFYEVEADSVDVLINSLAYVSQFLTFVIAFLMVYANQFLIKRRKKELGLYMTLGMNRLRISLILFLETLLTGIVSLLVGLGLGFIGSHFLSIITAKMFLVDLKEFRFIFSFKAMAKSLMTFGIVFVVMMILNTFNMAKVRLVNLLYSRPNERQKIKNKTLSIVLFILSIVSLVYAYYCITVNGMLSINGVFAQAIIFGIIGSFLFFVSLGSIMLMLLKKNKKLYFFQLNMFSIRQIYSKVNTTFALMAIISIMLLIAIGTFATGNGAAMALNQTLDNSLPYDISINSYDKPIDFKDLPGQHIPLNFYTSDLSYKEFAESFQMGMMKFDMKDEKMEMIPLSQLNKGLQARGLEPVSMAMNEFIITYNMTDFGALYGNRIGETFKLAGQNMTLKDLFKVDLTNSYQPMNLGIIVIHDEWINKDSKHITIMNVLVDDAKAYEDQLNQQTGSWSFISREAVISQSLSLSVLVTYISIYVGIVFIMASVVILSLQQLSEASDNAKRYDLLKKLGVEEKQIKHSILIQITSYFILPMMLAIIHSIVGINVSSKVVKIFGNLDVLENVLITASFVLAIYGSYFIATYISIKSMVLNNY